MLDFSVIVPSYGNPENVRELLSCLSNLSYPISQFEVIIVDDGNPTPLSSIVSQQNDLSLTLLEQSNMGPAFARNRAAAIAQGRHLAFTDDDCRPQPGWLEALADALGDSDCRVCRGRTLNGLPDNIYSEATQLLLDYLSQNLSPTTTNGAFSPSNNFALSKKAFINVGGFDPALRFGEDRDFCYRCSLLGYSFVSASDAVIYHYHPQTLLSFFRLHSRYGGGTYAFRCGCAAKGLPRPRINPPSWYINLILAGIREIKSPRGATLSLLLATSQAAALAGMLRVKLARP